MGVKLEIGWTTIREDGGKRHVTAEKHGKEWKFFERPKRKGADVQWIEMENPPLSDWLELLEAVQRRYQRDLAAPDKVEHLKRLIRERFPEHKF